MKVFRQLKNWLVGTRPGLVSVAGSGEAGSYLVASTEQADGGKKETSIRGRLQSAKLIEASVNPETAPQIASFRGGDVEYPDDYGDWQDYLDAYLYVPFVARAVDIKQAMMWQMGYTLETENEEDKEKGNRLLQQVQADTTLRRGTLYALLFGNMYWHIIQKQGEVRLHPLNPLKMGGKVSQGTIQEYVYSPQMGDTESFPAEEILHLRFNVQPWDCWGTSTLRRVLPTVKAMLFMEEKLPWLARRRGDPLLQIQIGTEDSPVDQQTFQKIKNAILNRQAGQDIFHDGTVEISEVYQTGGIASRQMLEPLLGHFRENLVAGLGVPDVALGFGGTTTMATAEYQERLLEAEVRAYQRVLKRLHEHRLFPLAEPSGQVKVVWRPLKEEDKVEKSEKLQGEIEHGIVGPVWARQQLGYPEEAGENTVIKKDLVPLFSQSKRE